MSVLNVQSKPLFFPQPEEEQVDLEKLTSQQVNEMALYVHQLVGEIYQLSLTASLRALHGDRFVNIGKESALQLRVLTLLPPTKKTETNVLKQKIAESNLSKAHSFSERKAQVDSGKHTECKSVKVLENNSSVNQCKVQFQPKAHEEHAEHEKSATEGFIELCAGKTCHVIEHTKGKPIAIAFEILGNTLLNMHKDQKNPNVVRDSLVSAATHLCMLETLTLVAPGRVPVYAAIAGSHIVAAGARAAEKAVDKVAADAEVEYWWNRQAQLCPEIPQFTSSVYTAKGLLKIAQFPSGLLNAVHHHIDATVKHDLDRMGLTQENVASTAIKTLIFIGKNSPEYLEEQMWYRTANAIAANKKAE